LTAPEVSKSSSQSSIGMDVFDVHRSPSGPIFLNDPQQSFLTGAHAPLDAGAFLSGSRPRFQRILFGYGPRCTPPRNFPGWCPKACPRFTPAGSAPNPGMLAPSPETRSSQQTQLGIR
jgi:hypothetical protein